MNQQIQSIALVYNRSEILHKGEAGDIIAEQGVFITVEAVDKALSFLGHRISCFPVNRKTHLKLPQDLLAFKPDLVFNLCESFEGCSQMEKNMAALFEILLLPYTGSDPLTLGFCLNKFKTKKLLSAFRLPVPKGFLIEVKANPRIKNLRYPMIVKPNSEDGSLGINSYSVVNNESELKKRIIYIHRKYLQPALVEEYIDGREINVAVIGNEKPRVLPFSEIDFSGLPPNLPKICSYHSKWVEGTPEYNGTGPICPAEVPEKIRKRIEKVALKAYRIIGCRDYARVDIRVTREGRPYILEINPNADLSPDAGLARSGKAAGMGYAQLIAYIVSESTQRTKKYKLEKGLFA